MTFPGNLRFLFNISAPFMFNPENHQAAPVLLNLSASESLSPLFYISLIKVFDQGCRYYPSGSRC